jgi:hypothetical protein
MNSVSLNSTKAILLGQPTAGNNPSGYAGGMLGSRSNMQMCKVVAKGMEAQVMIESSMSSE